MTNSTTTSLVNSNRTYGQVDRKSSDAAPMVITRLSGWIDVNESRTAGPAWILPTKVSGGHK